MTKPCPYWDVHSFGQMVCGKFAQRGLLFGTGMAGATRRIHLAGVLRLILEDIPFFADADKGMDPRPDRDDGLEVE